MWVDGAIIVGAGPSGLATAACLSAAGIGSSVILEKNSCIGSLWQNRTYDRLRLHIPKQFCELPMSPFPDSFPIYPTRTQFVDYLENYAAHFQIRARFHECVQSAVFDPRLGLWRVRTIRESGEGDRERQAREYVGRWLVVASGENAEPLLPWDLPGLASFRGSVKHSSEFKNGCDYAGKSVLVVGSGNSGMEIALDLVQHNAKPAIVVRSPVHILPREMLGFSTYSVAMKLLKHLPVWLADRLLVSYAIAALGSTARHGIRRPDVGPMEMKAKTGRTPVLDVGTLSKIKAGKIKVRPSLESLSSCSARFSDGQQGDYDAIIFATGYKSNVPQWLKGEVGNSFSADGFPRCGWKGERGLYVAGLSRKGIFGGSKDAQMIAEDISKEYSLVRKLVSSNRAKQQQQQ
ncbi:hypothetical protein SELMODRAFT_102211 [Selaginella moellendorffii]|uniref:Flavin-containing monooxygenase n=1 Tax=Selaginella moellendorffii TaxID=88036 RepID=D8RUF4_SELML|nr:probable indole-3-pyruvate monooxygenase YUCCA8 [Selaginella moellendorffii]EFJ24400.1 hypothetical protein SELMODRAFT_102211 [Selaginella moellendorffii]|eukprot:XP_002974880.1 probable indole-3-pyruvate monooxygenase YUCCA8 [Selaginella moellendorffii]